jgi:hypothetical protein
VMLERRVFWTACKPEEERNSGTGSPAASARFAPSQSTPPKDSIAARGGTARTSPHRLASPSTTGRRRLELPRFHDRINARRIVANHRRGANSPHSTAVTIP